MSLLQRVAGLARRFLSNGPAAAEPPPRAPQGQPANRPQAAAPERAVTPPAERLQPADEATIRHRAEAELGGTSSEESRRAWERGENPGGLHHKGHGPTAAHRGTADPAVSLDPGEHDNS